MISEICEIGMIVLFGVSWPMNVIKSFKARTAKGKSIAFLFCILSGYIVGIIGKLISGNFKWYVVIFYILNFIMVSIDIVLYFRNVKLDKKALG